MDEARVRRMELNEAIEAVGKLGPFHFRLFACLFLVGIFHGARLTSGYYFLYDQDHSCYVPVPSPNGSLWVAPPDGHDIVPTGDSSCYVYVSKNESMLDHQQLQQQQQQQSRFRAREDNDSDGDDGTRTPCPHGWVYSKTVMTRTATSEYNLVCDKKLYPSHANTALMLGSLLGSVVFGKVSDRFGRKVAFHAALMMFVAFGVGIPFSNNYYTFVVLFGLSGAATTGLFAAAIVTAMEFVLPEDRKIPGLLMNVFFPLGEMIMTGIAFGARDWRWIGVAISAPAALFFSYYWFVPESIRWLMLHKQYKKLDVILRNMAKQNGREVPEDYADDEEGFAELLHSNEFPQDADRRVQRRDSFFDLFRHCVLAIRVLLTSYNWLTVNLAYFGLVFYSTNLCQGLFMNFFLGAIVEAPAHITSLLLVDRVGRKYVHCTYFLLVVVATGISIVVAFEIHDKKWILLLMTMIGKFGAAGLTGTCYLWMTELYPTSVRSTGLGVGTASARVGAILSSYVIDFGEHMESSFGKALPYIVICVASSLAFIGCLFLPETSNKTLPSTIEGALHFGRNQERAALRGADRRGGGYGALNNHGDSNVNIHAPIA